VIGIGTSPLAYRILAVVANFSRSARSVDVTAVSRAENNDLSPLVVNPVQNAVGATSGTPDPVQLVAERRANPPWTLPKRVSYEVNDCKRDSFGECLSDCPRG
jgi:hypothetical protein